MLKRTPLFKSHQKLGAHLVEFGGWEMPLSYTGIIDEHLTVRSAAGLFDISHMGEFSVSGSAAVDFLNFVLTNDARKLQPGQGQYTIMCNERGGAIDDLYAYRLGEVEFLLIVNAARIEADFDWLKKQLAAFPSRASVELKDRSSELAAALQKNEIARFNFDGRIIWVSRTGYTGEDGFEIVAEAEIAEPLWDKLLATGQSAGIKPAGLGARDTLRTEVCYPLYGHELDENTSPLEAGLGFFVALGKGEFIGREVLARQKAQGPPRKLAAFKMAERGAPPRPGYAIWSAGDGAEAIGKVASGTQSPSLGIGIGLGFVAPAFSPVNTAIAVEVRGRRVPAVIVPRPIYKRS
jgi:aminomethyltransferase